MGSWSGRLNGFEIAEQDLDTERRSDGKGKMPIVSSSNCRTAEQAAMLFGHPAMHINKTSTALAPK